MNIHTCSDLKDGFIADNATVIGSVVLGKGVNIWFGAVIRADKSEIAVGDSSNIQDNVVIHSSSDYKVKIGSGVSVGHGAIIHGCNVEDNVLVGMGAIILNGAHIGEGSIIGAGALVTEGKEIPPRSLVLGVPGKVVKQVSDDQYNSIIQNAKEYVSLGQRYKNE